MEYVITPPAPALVPVALRDGSFPVRRIYCVGRNYAAHIREMGFDPEREAPFFFCKPADSVVNAHPSEEASIAYPIATTDFQYEIELVVAIGIGGADVDPENALKHVFGYAVGIDMTRRDLQIAARKAGRPWDTGKAFDQSAPIGWIHAAGDVAAPGNQEIWLQVNGLDRQRSTLDKLIWSVPEIIAALSRLFRLEPGDLIFTGTPEGVGPVVPGDVITAGIAGLSGVQVKVA